MLKVLKGKVHRNLVHSCVAVNAHVGDPSRTRQRIALLLLWCMVSEGGGALGLKCVCIFVCMYAYYLLITSLQLHSVIPTITDAAIAICLHS